MRSLFLSGGIYATPGLPVFVVARFFVFDHGMLSTSLHIAHIQSVVVGDPAGIVPEMPRNGRAILPWRFSNLRLVAHVVCAPDTGLNEPAILRAKGNQLLLGFLSPLFDVPAGRGSPRCIGASLLHRSTRCSQKPNQAIEALLFRLLFVLLPGGPRNHSPLAAFPRLHVVRVRTTNQY